MKNIFLLCTTTVLLTACVSDGAGETQTPDGNKINLSISDKGWVRSKTKNGELLGYNSPSSFYGIWIDDGNQVSQVRFQGDETKDMPASGRATYYGNAIRYDSVSDGALRVDGATKLNVDFAAKTVNGTIEMPGLRRDITLNTGRINGTSYAGRASVSGDNSGRYQGGFFGDNAKETAGMVEFGDDTSLNTAFGGTRY